ncbi:MAG: hypothetical protein AB1489_32720 [Acidobacteriota bacterium]
MKVVIYFNDLPKPEIYYLDSSEYHRLINDFQQYQKEATPTRGMYSFYTDAAFTQQKIIHLFFEVISAID